MTILTERNIERFWSKVNKGKKNECWLWLESCVSAGYGYFGLTHTVNGVKKLYVGAHRFSLMLKLKTEELNGMCLHSCDNPKCVNPHHLSLGTNSENIRQAFDRGLMFGLKGEKHGRAILTEKDVLWIRKHYPLGGHTYKSLAAKYGVGETTIAEVIKRMKWKHI